MDDLIEALTIFRKYKNEEWPTNCCHDWLGIMGVEKDEVSAEDKERLSQLSFFWSEEFDCWGSNRFGSA